MPSVRKSTGRAVTPVRQPEVASAKQAQLDPPAVVAFPMPPDVELSPEGGAASLEARLRISGTFSGGFAPPPAPALADLDAALRPPLRSENRVERFDVPRPFGTRWSGEAGAPAETEGASAVLARLRPRLAPGVFEADVGTQAFPAPVREDQLEMVRSLAEGGDTVLIGDPGSGFETGLLLALRELLHSARIEKALLIAPAGMILSWERWLGQWAPEVGAWTLADPSAGRGFAWPPSVHLVLADPFVLQDALRDSPERSASLACDVVALTSYVAFRRRGGDPASFLSIPADRRWVLAGGPPPEADDWRALHRYLHPTWAGVPALAEIQDRLARQTLRRTKASLTGILPRRSRIEIWLELGPQQREAYDEVLEEERARLERLGGAVNRTHVLAALARLKHVMAFRPGMLDGVKVRVLVDLVEEILASGAKIVVVGPSDQEVLTGLVAVLDAYGALRLDSAATDEEQRAILDRFRHDPRSRVLVADTETRGDGEPLEGASYIIHFGHEWNPAHRRRTEQRLFPDLGPSVPQTVLELWVAGSVEERYHALLASQGLLAADIAHETRPKDIEERLTILEWLSTVFEVGSMPTLDRTKGGGTGKLPGTGALREAWARFDAERLAASAESLMRALGFTQVERISGPTASGCDFLGWHTRAEGAQRVFIRCLRSEAAIGVDEARRVLAEAEAREDCVGAYLIATAEFTAACRRFADQSEGRLALVDGAEFYRHLQVLGVLKDG